MKLLIADDDEIIRKNFLEKIPWAENGYEVVGVAQNGYQAYEMALYNCPDIILTDIEMPLLSGLELADKLKDILENCKIIFLSAYDSFDYAREALRLHACEYILKNSREEEILQAVNHAADEIRSRNKNVHLSILGRELLEKNRIIKLLQNNVETEEMRALCLDMDHHCYQVVTLKSDEQKNVVVRPSESIGMENELTILLKNYVGKTGGRYWVSGWNQYHIVLFELKKGEEDILLSVLDEILVHLEEKMSYEVTVGLGRICSNENDFSKSFDDAIFAVNDDTQGKIRRYKELGQSKAIREIRDYIQKNYMDPELSLNKLSEQVYLSPAYISSLFKRYMDSNFKEYLVRLRIKEACRILENMDVKSYEVSEMVGYPNPQYFSVLFKKITGEAPTQYHNRFWEGRGNENHDE